MFILNIHNLFTNKYKIPGNITYSQINTKFQAKEHDGLEGSERQNRDSYFGLSSIPTNNKSAVYMSVRLPVCLFLCVFLFVCLPISRSLLVTNINLVSNVSSLSSFIV